MLIAGLLIAGSAPWLYGGERWVLDDPERPDHVTALAADHEQRLYRGAQGGGLRQWSAGEWRDVGNSPDGLTILALLPERQLAATSRALWNWTDQAMLELPEQTRVSHLLPHGEGLLVGTGTGVLYHADGDWEDGGLDAQVYRIILQQRDTGPALHAGSIAEGVWTLPAGQLGADARWQANSRGLPDPVNVLSLLTAGNDALIAGTDQGVYWQPRDGGSWRRMEAGLGQPRVLALARTLTGSHTTLWAGSDDGVYRVRLVERERALETQGRWERLDNPPEGLDQSVSWIVPLDDRIWIAAGSVYRLDAPRDDRWMLQLAAGLFLAAGGLYRLRKR